MNSMDAGASIIGILFMLIMITIGFLGLIFWIWMLVHAIKNKGLTDNERLVWVLVIIFVSFLGAVIYFFAGRPKATNAS